MEFIEVLEFNIVPPPLTQIGPFTESLWAGAELPIPTLPLAIKYVPVPTVKVFVIEAFAYVAELDDIVLMYVALTNTPLVFTTMPVLARTETLPVEVIVPPFRPLAAII